MGRAPGRGQIKQTILKIIGISGVASEMVRQGDAPVERVIGKGKRAGRLWSNGAIGTGVGKAIALIVKVKKYVETGSGNSTAVQIGIQIWLIKRQ